MCLGLTIRKLMLCLVFVGRTSGSWFRMHSLILRGSPGTSGSFDLFTLERQCYSFLTQGLAPSTHRSYASAQAHFISFCHQLGKLNPSWLPCPADEWTLCLFVTFLARTIKHYSIKVYLSGVRALHIDHGFPDPLINCLRLQRVVRGIKRCQGSSSSGRLPITDHLMLVIWQSLDLHRITASFGQLVPLDILAFFVLLSLPFPICLASRRHSTWVSRTFQWICPQLHPACTSGSRARRLIHLGRAVSFTLALAGVHSAQFVL